MSQGDLEKLLSDTKNLLIADSDWYLSFVPSQHATTPETDTELTALVKASATLARIKLTSRWTGPTKNTTVEITADDNSLTDPGTFKTATARILNKIISQNNWAEQKGSDSPVDAILKDLDQAVIASGGKVTKPRGKAVRSNTTVTANITSTDLSLADRVTKVAKSFDPSLVSLINARLPEAVRNNMTGGALHNRTGRFSESVRITAVERTPQGYPRLAYTYQRSPYDVFDTVLGKRPWNIPGRDPKPLIERSIRDIAREMAIGRFYVRRQ